VRNFKKLKPDKMYNKIKEQQQKILNKLNKQKTILSWSRLALLLAAIYFFYLMLYNKDGIFGFYAFVLFVIFLVVVNFYIKKQKKVTYHQTLKKINENEIAFLNDTFTFDSGIEYLNPQHAFSYDLDLFGDKSIFQFLNRTATSLGKNRLAQSLQEIPSSDVIEARQRAIKELADNMEFRQHFQTLAAIADTSEKENNAIKNWSEIKTSKPNVVFNALAIVLPVLLLFSIVVSFFNIYPISDKLILFIFSLNLLLTGLFSKNILQEVGKSDKIANSLQQYAKMIQYFNETKFESNYLLDIQNKLKKDKNNANLALNDLSNIFEKLNTIANLFVFIAFNGTFQYHFWVYKKLQNWKTWNRL